jgi:hypothetical protein
VNKTLENDENPNTNGLTMVLGIKYWSSTESTDIRAKILGLDVGGASLKSDLNLVRAVRSF